MYAYTDLHGQVVHVWSLDPSGQVMMDGTILPAFGTGNTAIRKDHGGGLVFNDTTGTTQPTNTYGYSSPAAVRFTVSYEGGASCGLTDTGHGVCWPASPFVPSPAQPGPDDLIALDVGGTGGAGLTPDGRVLWWGPDAAYLQARTPTDVVFTEIAVGAQPYGRAMACGVRADGYLECFGDWGWPGRPWF